LRRRSLREWGRRKARNPDLKRKGNGFIDRLIYRKGSYRSGLNVTGLCNRERWAAWSRRFVERMVDEVRRAENEEEDE
jgi:hypothetical protein